MRDGQAAQSHSETPRRDTRVVATELPLLRGKLLSGVAAAKRRMSGVHLLKFPDDIFSSQPVLAKKKINKKSCSALPPCRECRDGMSLERAKSSQTGAGEKTVGRMKLKRSVVQHLIESGRTFV